MVSLVCPHQPCSLQTRIQPSVGTHSTIRWSITVIGVMFGCLSTVLLPRENTRSSCTRCFIFLRHLAFPALINLPSARQRLCCTNARWQMQWIMLFPHLWDLSALVSFTRRPCRGQLAIEIYVVHQGPMTPPAAQFRRVTRVLCTRVH